MFRQVVTCILIQNKNPTNHLNKFTPVFYRMIIVFLPDIGILPDNIYVINHINL